MRLAFHALIGILTVIWACSACTFFDPAAACERADDIPGHTSRARYHLFKALDCRLATFSPDFAAAFKRDDISSLASLDELRTLIRALESVPSPGGDPAEALAVVCHEVIEAGAIEVIGPVCLSTLHRQLESELSTHHESFSVAFDQDVLQRLSIDQLHLIYTKIIDLPRGPDEVLANLAIISQVAASAKIDATIVADGYTRVLSEEIASLISERHASFADVIKLDALDKLALSQLQALHGTIVALPLPRGPEEVLANLAIVSQVAASAKIDDTIVADGYTRVLSEEITSLIGERHASFADVIKLDALDKLSLRQLQALHGTIVALPKDAQARSKNLGLMYDSVHGAGSSVDVVTASYKLALVRDIAEVIAVAHPNLQDAFRHEGLQRLDIEHLRKVLRVLEMRAYSGRDARSMFGFLHSVLLQNGLSDGASRLGYRDLLERQIDAAVRGMHENFRRVFDGSALSRSPIRHLEVLEEALRDLPPGKDRDGAAALIAVHMAGEEAGVDLNIGYSRLIAELRAPIVAGIEETLASMAPEFVDAFSPSGMAAMPLEVLRAVLRELESLPDRGANVGSGVARVLAAAVAAGHDPSTGDFGARALRAKMQAVLKTVIGTLDDEVRSYLKTDAVDGTNVQLSHLQAVLAAVTAVRNSRDPIEALATIHVAAVNAGMEVAKANFGLTDAVVSKLQERFSDDRILSRADPAAYLMDHADAVALPVFRTAARFYIPTNDPVGLIEAMHVSAVQAGMNPDSTDFGKQDAMNLLTPVQVTKTWITTASTGEAVFRWNLVNYYDVGIKAVRFAIYAYDSFGGALGGGCLPFPARGELRLTRAQQYGRSGQSVGGLSWWWDGWRCTARADRFDLRIRDVVFVDDTRWTP